jgi:hypothetical protein
MRPEPPLQVGEEIIAFLIKNEDQPDVFWLPYSTYSVFWVRGDQVVDTNKRVTKTRPLDSYNLADVEARIRELVATDKR